MYTRIVQRACAKTLSSNMLTGNFWDTRAMQERQNQVACMQAIDFVRDPPLLLSLTSSSEISGSSCGSCLIRNDAPLRVSVARSERGMKGFKPLGSIAIPPIIAQKLCVFVQGFFLERLWLSGSDCCSGNLHKLPHKPGLEFVTLTFF